MNALAVTLLGYILLAVELAVRPALALGSTGIAPHFLIVLVVFVAMMGSGVGVYWAAVLMGLAIDLTNARALVQGSGIVTTMGPHALGYLVAAWLVVTIRGVMMRRSPLALPFLSLVATALAELIAVFLLTVHAMMDSSMSGGGWSIGEELAVRMGGALYTAAAALVLSPIFRAMQPILGLEDASARRFGR